MEDFRAALRRPRRGGPRAERSAAQGGADRRDGRRRSDSASTWPRSSSGWLRSGPATPAVRLLVPGRPGAGRALDGGGQALPLQPPQRRPPGARRRLRPADARRRARGGRSTPRCASRSTSGTARSSRGWSCSELYALDGETEAAADRVQHSCRCERRGVVAAAGGRAEPARGGHPAKLGRPLAPRGRAPRQLARPRSSPSWSPAAKRCWHSAPTPRAARRLPAAPPAWPASAAPVPRWSAVAAPGRSPRPRPARGLLLADYATLELEPALVAAHRHVVLIDPPWSRRLATLDRAARSRSGRAICTRPGARRRSASRSRSSTSSWGCGRRCGRSSGTCARPGRWPSEELRGAARAASGRRPRSPELAGRCLRVLAGAWDRARHARAAALAPSGSYPRMRPIWSARGPSRLPRPPRGGQAIPRKPQTAGRQPRSPSRSRAPRSGNGAARARGPQRPHRRSAHPLIAAPVDAPVDAVTAQAQPPSSALAARRPLRR